MKIILASSSPNRKRILAKAGLAFEAFSPNIDEESLINPKKPEESCLQIAREKALKARIFYKKELIIACDQMACLKGRIFGKAQTEQKAIEALIQLKGKSHSLLTGLFMLWEGRVFSYLCKSRMSMRPLSLRQIRDYVEEEKPLLSAGSYHIESQGIKLFEKIETEDFNAIEGLPLIQVINRLGKWGYPLWREKGGLSVPSAPLK